MNRSTADGLEGQSKRARDAMEGQVNGKTTSGGWLERYPSLHGCVAPSVEMETTQPASFFPWQGRVRSPIVAKCCPTLRNDIATFVDLSLRLPKGGGIKLSYMHKDLGC